MSLPDLLLLNDESSSEAIESEIRELEDKLAQAKLRLSATTTNSSKTSHAHQDAESHNTPYGRNTSDVLSSKPLLCLVTGRAHVANSLVAQPHLNPTTHFLLLLADSALPLGSFAFSSGLESYLAHAKALSSSFSSSSSSSAAASARGHHHHYYANKPSFDIFLPLSISSYASTTLPFLLAAHRDPSQLPDLDDALDAAVICTVGKRASVAQGRALLGIWERSFYSPSSSSLSSPSAFSSPIALEALTTYTKLLRTPITTTTTTATTPDDTQQLLPPVSAHLAPLFGVIASLLGLTLDQTAYVFMLGHVKALVSAAVRANLMGPYAAQKVLASGATQEMIAAAVEREWTTPYEEAGQGVPVMDLWVGRHEMLYSRIFNS